jgi:N-acetylneuraminic acid mutarotase
MHILIVLLAASTSGMTEDAPQSTAPAVNYPPIPEKVTSFGAAILDGQLYIYGGHTGRPHSYDRDAQGDTLRRLNLRNPKAWEALAEGPGLQGLALVADQGKLYRVGGFTAKNPQGDEHDLWSQADVARYDADQNQWVDLSPLPEPRSSFDAAVLDHKIYAIGGWKLAGDADQQWHKTAYCLDVSAVNPQWQPLPDPPFQRRALAVAAYDGKIYVIGGMQQQGGPTKRVDIFDPKTRQWSQGPTLQGEPMDGFGPAAFAAGGRLYVSTYSGLLQRLSEDGQSWQTLAELERARFFHRMLPLGEDQLILVGGASMESGKFDQIDVVNVAR